MKNLHNYYIEMLRSFNFSEAEISKYNEEYGKQSQTGISNFIKAIYQFQEYEKNGKRIQDYDLSRGFGLSRHSYFETAGNLVYDAIEQIPSLKGNKASFLVRSFPSGSINAEVRRINGDYLILINEGLGTFFLVLLSIILRSKRFQSNLFVETLGRTYDQDHEVELLGKLLHEYLITGYISDNNQELFLNGITPFDELLFDVYISLYNEVCSFIVGHELSHLSLGHLDKSMSKSWLSPKGRIDLINKSKLEEYEADATAAYVLFSSNRIRRRGGVPLKEEENRDIALMETLGGMTLFLFIASWIEDYSEALARELNVQLPVNHTHPSAIHRLNHLVDFLMMKNIILDFERSGYAIWFIQHLNPLKDKVFFEILKLSGLEK